MSPEIQKQYEEGMVALIISDLRRDVTLYSVRTLKSECKAWADILKYLLKYISEEVMID